MITFSAPYDGPYTIMFLPDPEFGDSVALQDGINVFQAMDNTLYTTIKTNTKKQLILVFQQLTRKKQQELQAYLDKFIDVESKLVDHHDRIWKIWNMNLAPRAVAEKRMANYGEGGSFTLEMIGEQIS